MYYKVDVGEGQVMLVLGEAKLDRLYDRAMGQSASLDERGAFWRGVLYALAELDLLDHDDSTPEWGKR